jgi:membrane associated rhomboid family serine protease
LVLASGTLGNALTAWAYAPEPFQSIGASTAVFGALGILTGYGVYVALAFPQTSPWRAVLLPVGGGVALLGWFGAGGVDTDVGGHLAGFGCGLALGFAAAWWRLRGAGARAPGAGSETRIGLP